MPKKHTFMLLVEQGPGGLEITDGHGNDCSQQHAHHQDHNSFCWIARSGTLTITFTNGHPFVTAPVAGQVVDVDPTKAVRPYDYDVALTLSGEEPLVQDPKVIIDNGRDRDIDLAGSAADDAKAVLESLVTQLVGAAGPRAEPNRLFFPNGIESISLTVKTVPPDVEITVAGPKPA